MRLSMNTALSGSGRVDDIQSHPQGEFRGQTNLVKITEDVRKFSEMIFCGLTAHHWLATP